MNIKRQTYIWIIAILAVFNLGTIAAILYHISNTTKENQATRAAFTTPGRDGMPRVGRMMMEKLNLDSGQIPQFTDINYQFRQEGADITRKLNHLRIALMEGMSAEKPDTLYLNMLSDSVGIMHAQLKKETYRYYLNLNKICNQQQKDSLKRYFEDEFSNSPQKRMHQKGKRMGRRR